MTTVITSPAETAQQISGQLPHGVPVLAVLARRTYDVDESGNCVPAGSQSPLVVEPVDDPDMADLRLAETDLVVHKPRTDLVVHGHAYGAGAPRLSVGVRVGGHTKEILVVGERRCELRGSTLVFSDPAPIDRVPLSYTRAYGGRDRVAERRYGPAIRAQPEFQGISDEDWAGVSPFSYPRNPCGRGYLVQVDDESVAALELPQLEDPLDPLTPERLPLPQLDRWSRMPLPQGTGWIHPTWYPRIAMIGIVPACDGFDAPPAEVTRGLVPPALAAGDGTFPPDYALEYVSGASLGLQLPHVRGGELVELRHLHPARSVWKFVVPPAPELGIDARDGTVRPVEAVLHTLLVEPDEDRVTVVWGGFDRAKRPYAPHELQRMPLRVAWAR